MKYRLNWPAFWLAVAAVTRGAAYAIPTREHLPPVLDVLPRGLVAIYGVLWFIAGGLSLTSILTRRFLKTGRAAMFAMFETWAAFYLFGQYNGVENSWVGACLYGLVGAAAFCKPYLDIVVPVGEPRPAPPSEAA